jgi:hypothetical protein
MSCNSVFIIRSGIMLMWIEFSRRLSCDDTGASGERMLAFRPASIRSAVHTRAVRNLWHSPAYRHSRELNISNIWCLHIQSISGDVGTAKTAWNIDRAWDMGYSQSLVFLCLCTLQQLSKRIFQRKKKKKRWGFLPPVPTRTGEYRITGISRRSLLLYLVPKDTYCHVIDYGRGVIW